MTNAGQSAPQLRVVDGSARVPPSSIGAEQSVIGAALIRQALPSEAGELTVDDFFLPAHRAIWEAMVAVERGGKKLDPFELESQLKAAGDFQRLEGGIDYLLKCAGGTPTAENAGHYVRIVREKALLRRLINLCAEVASRAYGEPGSVVDFIAEARAAVMELESQGSFAEPVRVGNEVGRVLAAIEERSKAPDAFSVMTGIHRFDRLTGGLREGKLIIVAARPGQGKAQPVNAPVLTPTGWRCIGDLRVGDRVIGSDGLGHAVTGVFPQGVKRVYEVVLDDGGTAECCDEHLWTTRTDRDRKNGRSGQVRPLHEIRASLRRPDGGRNHSLPICQPVHFEASNAPLPLHPYVLGVFLGDGTLSNSVRISKRDPDVRRRVEALLPPGDRVSDDHGGGFLIRRAEKGIKPSTSAAALRAMGYVGCDFSSKFVPPEYLTASSEERLELLRGLFDTDGYVTDPGGKSIEYTTGSLALKNAVVFLAGSLGAVVRWTARKPTYDYKGEKRTGALSYRVIISFSHGGVVPVTAPKHVAKWSGTPNRVRERFIVDVRESGERECVCIRVDAEDQLYVTSDFILTHNTAWVGTVGMNAAMKYKVPVFISSIEMSSDELIERFLASESSVSTEAIATGAVAKTDQFAHVFEAGRRLAPIPLDIDDRGHVSIAKICSSIRRWYSKNLGAVPPKGQPPKLALAAVDYLQIIAEEGNDERRDRTLGKWTSALKALSKSLRIPIVLLSQLNRKAADRSGGRPQLQDLRESGSIEQDADMVIFPHRELPVDEEEAAKARNEPGDMEWVIAKNRGGRCGIVPVHWLPAYTRFENRLADEQPAHWQDKDA